MTTLLHPDYFRLFSLSGRATPADVMSCKYQDTHATCTVQWLFMCAHDYKFILETRAEICAA